MECVICKLAFDKASKGYKRYSVHRKKTGCSQSCMCIADCISDIYHITIEVRDDLLLFICVNCYAAITRLHRLKSEVYTAKASLEQRYSSHGYIAEQLGKTTGNIQEDQRQDDGNKRKQGAESEKSSVPHKRRRCIEKVTSRSFKDSIITNITNSKYDRAIKQIYKHTQCGRKAINTCIKTFIRHEIKEYFKYSSLLETKLSIDEVRTFDWNSILEQTETRLPLLNAALTAALTTSRKEDKISTCPPAIGPLVPTLGVILSMVLHARNRQRYRLIQNINSVQMYRTGCSQKLLKWFSKIGICSGICGTRAIVDRLILDYDAKIISWKTNIQKHLGNFNTERKLPQADAASLSTSDESSTDQYGVSDSDELTDVDVADVETSTQTMLQQEKSCPDPDPLHSDDDEKEPGYAICWDNVQKLSVVRHQMQNKPNKMMMWALAFGVNNRISFTQLSSQHPRKCASDIPLHNFLPSQRDLKTFRERAQVVIKRILTQVFACLKDAQVVHHIEHKYSTESAMRSEIVHLGVIDQNPATAKGVTEIMKQLLRYVPVDAHGNPYVIICNGDQLSVERMLDARRVMALSTKPIHRLDALEPRPQGFHKRCILMQDTQDQLFTGRSAGDVGTLFQIKTKFGHRQVSGRVSECTNHFMDLMEFVSRGMTALLAMHLLGVDSIEAVADAFKDEDDIEMNLNELSQNIINEVWPYADTIVDQVTDGETGVDDGCDNYCVCDSGDEISNNEMIECSGQEHCTGGRWFHASCVNVEPADYKDDDWWCSNNCNKYTIFCCHQTKQNTKWIGCESGKKCESGEWFHLECKGFKRLPGGKWYCSTECRVGKDAVRQYSCALLFRSLYHLVERDAERENDGDMMMSLWRINAIDFWINHHNKYQILCHRLQAEQNRTEHYLYWYQSSDRTCGIREHKYVNDTSGKMAECNM